MGGTWAARRDDAACCIAARYPDGPERPDAMTHDAGFCIAARFWDTQNGLVMTQFGWLSVVSRQWSVVKDRGWGGRDEAIRPAGDEVTLVTGGGSPLRSSGG